HLTMYYTDSANTDIYTLYLHDALPICGSLKRIGFKVLQQAKRAQRGITLLKELKKLPHRIVAAHIIHPDDTTYTITSKRHEESGNIKDIHLSEQYTNGSFIVDVKEFGEVENLIIK